MWLKTLTDTSKDTNNKDVDTKMGDIDPKDTQPESDDLSDIEDIYLNANPHEGLGVKSRMCPPYPQRDRKRRLNGAVCRNHRIKRVVPCRC